MRFKKLIALTLVSLTVAGCGGTMQGVVRGTGKPIVFNYEQGMSSDNLTAAIDGEEFQGKAVMRGATTTVGNAFGTSTAGAATAYGTSTFFGSTYTGDVVATLLGSRGSTLSCQLQYADSSGFTTAGGVGVCQHSDGRVIDVLW